MERDLACLRCGAKMHFIKREKFQLGEAGWILGDLPHLNKGAMELEIYSCPDCGKVEFFQSTGDEQLPQVKCPRCGKVHDFDYGRCPFCKYEY